MSIIIPKNDENPIAMAVGQLFEPGAWPDTKSAQVHGVNDVFAAGDGMDGDRNDQRGQFFYLSKEPAAQFFDLITSRFLCVHGEAKVASKCGNKTHGQIHAVGDLIRQAKATEGDSVMSRVERIRMRMVMLAMLNTRMSMEAANMVRSR